MQTPKTYQTTNSYQTTKISQIFLTTQVYTNSQDNSVITNEMIGYINTYVNFWTLTSIACLGLVTNSLNIAVFFRQGFSEGVTRSMLAIALWDLLKCACAVLHRMFGPISLASPSLSTSWLNFTLPYVEYTTLFAGYVSYSLTAFVSVERCLCVSRPFTVKIIFTPRFTSTILISISILVYGAYFVMFFIYVVVYDFSPTFNATIAKYIYSNFYYTNGAIVMVYYQTVAILIPTLSFLILCMSSAATVHYLRRSSKFLHKVGDAVAKPPKKKDLGISPKEKQAAKTLLVVVLVNILNLFPRTVFYVAQLAEPEFYLLRRYNNIFFLTTRLLTILDFIKASVNFFIYKSMSSNFNKTFLKLMNVMQQNKG
ncbi:uncharacterized protein LOC131939037 [Physella acuta]|uniref:uncharacterized protein LOC131939037 n=1 Tax=Physella acuta TaxID=109671 RepID=UPI0027DDBB65|nr:uncharacterized protein LOC131939037 [Physella acuta]